MIAGILALELTATAATGAEKNLQLKDVKSKIQQVDADMKNLAAEKAAQIEQLDKLDKQLAALDDDLFAIKLEIRRKEENLKTIRNQINSTKRNIQQQQRSLEGLVKAAYAMQIQKGLQMIFNQQDPSLSGRMLVYHDYISKAHLQKLALIKENYKNLQQLEADKDSENQLLQVSLDKKKQETDSIQVLRGKREKLVAQLDKDYLAKRTQKEKLRQDEKKLETLVASFQKTDDNASREPVAITETPRNQPQQELTEAAPPSSGQSTMGKIFSELRGQLPWPAKGSIIQHFGDHQIELTKNGVVIKAGAGTDIHAVAPGKVIFADWMEGYGLMLIIKHDQGYMSLYAFNQSLRKHTNEQVKAGDTVASVGKAETHSQSGLYFAILKNSVPVNPEHWLKNTRKP